MASCDVKKDDRTEIVVQARKSEKRVAQRKTLHFLLCSVSGEINNKRAMQGEERNSRNCQHFFVWNAVFLSQTSKEHEMLSQSS